MMTRKLHHCISILWSDAELRNTSRNCFSAVVTVVPKASAALICSLSSCHWFQRKAKHLQANWDPWSKHSWDIQGPQPMSLCYILISGSPKCPAASLLPKHGFPANAVAPGSKTSASKLDRCCNRAAHAVSRRTYYLIQFASTETSKHETSCAVKFSWGKHAVQLHKSTDCQAPVGAICCRIPLVCPLRSPVKPKTPRAPCVAHQLWEHLLLITIDATILWAWTIPSKITLFQPERMHFHQITPNQHPTTKVTNIRKIHFRRAWSWAFQPHSVEICTSMWSSQPWSGRQWLRCGSWHWRFSNHQKAESLQSQCSRSKRSVIICYSKGGLFSKLFHPHPHAVWISIVYK